MHVATSAFSFFEACATRGLIGLDELLEGSGYTLDGMQARRERYPWDDWARLCDRFAVLVGSEDAVASSVEQTIDDIDLTRLLFQISPMFLSASAAYRLALRYVGPSAYRGLDFSLDVLPDKSLAVAVEIPPPMRPSLAWMQIFATAMRLLPRLQSGGGAEARVDIQRLDGRGCHLRVTPPPSRTILSWIRRVWARLWRGDAMLTELEHQQGDLTRAYADLAAAERTVRLTLEGLPAGVALHRGGEVVLSNAPFQRLLGCEAVCLVDVARAVFGETVELTAIDGEAAVHRTTDGRFLEFTSQAGPDLAGRPTTMLFVRDVTAQTTLEQRVAVHDRMVAVGTLAAGTAHEINNPLTYLMLNLNEARELVTEHAAGQALDSALLGQLITDSIDGADRIRSIVAELQNFTRVRASSTRPVSMAKVVGRAVRLTTPTLKHRAAVHVDADPALWITGDENRLVQVVINLLTNAAKAIETDQEGSLHVRVRSDDGADVVVLEVQDNGCGISTENQRQLFDPFFTTRQHTGTGLGLSIVHRIVTDMGGSITVDSTPGHGSCFRLAFPAVVSPEVQVPPRSGAVGLGAKGRCVLLIDDDEMVRRGLARSLGLVHDVIVVESAVEGLARLSDGCDPDVILCDLMMDDMSGLDFYERLLESDLPMSQRVVFISGGVSSAVVRAQIERSGRPLLRKPIFRQALLEALERHARKRPPAPHDRPPSPSPAPGAVGSGPPAPDAALGQP